MAQVSNLFRAMGQFQIGKKMWSCPQQDTVWCHLANSLESVAQFKEPITDTVPQLERCSREGKISLLGGQNFLAGLVFSEFSVDLQKKKDHRANSVNFSPSSLLVSKK